MAFGSFSISANERAIYQTMNVWNRELTLNFTSFDQDGTLFTGHIGEVIKYCSNDSKYYCFAAPTIAFSLPKGEYKGDKWFMFGWEFTKKQPIKFSMIDTVLEVSVISARDMVKKGIRSDTCDHIFLFNEKYGIIANFRECYFESGNLELSYFLRGANGVGSSEFQKLITKDATLTDLQETLLFTEKNDWQTFLNAYKCIIQSVCTGEEPVF